MHYNKDYDVKLVWKRTSLTFNFFYDEANATYLWARQYFVQYH